MALAGETIREQTCVWDLPTRLFHWLFAGSFAVAWFTREQDRYLDLHVFAGYLFFGLLLFRLIWGFVGGRYARFSAFGYRWRSARDYLLATLRDNAPRHLGHNPAGSWAIFLMFALGLIVSLSGLLVLGGEERHGPLTGWIGFAAADVVRELHETGAFTLLALVLVHVAGVIFESWRHRENLVAAMITGYKRGQGNYTCHHTTVGVVMLAVVLAGAVNQSIGYVRATPAQPYLPFIGPSLPVNATWESECGGCHLAFHPSLLPARSWEALLDGQADHFGDDLALDPATLAELRAFARGHAAEAALTEAAWKINRSVPAQATPTRITGTGYWKRKHAGIPEAVWQGSGVRTRANCTACHLDAERGTFEDAAMHLPAPPDQLQSTMR
jgi:cytochrome b